MTDQDDKIPGASYLTFGELFGDGRSFEIPDYQRAYDWGKVQRDDLLSDLDRLDRLAQKGDGTVSHFCGTVICTPPEKDGGACAVVDGQQRLTTLCLLHGLLTKGETETLLREPGRTRFKPQAMDRDTFDKLLRGKKPQKPQTAAQTNYAGAAKEIDAWIRADAARAERALELIEKRLHFIFFVLRDETEVAKVFETINNRGKPLSQMDLVKNHLIYVAAINGWESPNVNEVWKNIQMTVGQTVFQGGDVDTVLRAVVTAQFKPGRRKAGETDFSIVSGALPSECALECFELFLSFLETSFKAFRKLRAANDTDPKKPVTRALTHLNHHDGISGVLPLILARQFQREKSGEKSKDASVLEAIEIANFRLYGLPGAAARSDSYNVTLHKLAHDYFRKSISDRDVVDDLRNLLAREQKLGLPAIVRSLSLNDDETFDYYDWGWLRYFLGRFEESLLDSQSFDFGRLRKAYVGAGHTNDYLTVEHIWPREHQDKTVKESNGGQQVRRLGNLMLLPRKLNIQLGNHDVEVKNKKSAGKNVTRLRQNREAETAGGHAKAFAEFLCERRDERFGEVKSRFDMPVVNQNHNLVFVRTLCDLREEAMIAFALEAWRFPGEAASEHVFKGMFSFAHKKEAYKISEESPANKENENFVISAAERASSAAARLAARQDVIVIAGDRIVPVNWA